MWNYEIEDVSANMHGTPDDIEGALPDPVIVKAGQRATQSSAKRALDEWLEDGFTTHVLDRTHTADEIEMNVLHRRAYGGETRRYRLYATCL